MESWRQKDISLKPRGTEGEFIDLTSILLPVLIPLVRDYLHPGTEALWGEVGRRMLSVPDSSERSYTLSNISDILEDCVRDNQIDGLLWTLGVVLEWGRESKSQSGELVWRGEPEFEFLAGPIHLSLHNKSHEMCVGMLEAMKKFCEGLTFPCNCDGAISMILNNVEEKRHWTKGLFLQRKGWAGLNISVLDVDPIVYCCRYRNITQLRETLADYYYQHEWATREAAEEAIKAGKEYVDALLGAENLFPEIALIIRKRMPSVV